jgi:hypothetical protein
MSSNKQPGTHVFVGEQPPAPTDTRRVLPVFNDFVIDGLTFEDIRNLPLAQRLFFENRVEEGLTKLDPFLKCVPEELRDPSLTRVEILRASQNLGLEEDEVLRLIAEDDLTTTIKHPKQVKDVIFRILDGTTLVGVYILFYIRIRSDDNTELVVSVMGQLSPIRRLGVPFWGEQHSLEYVIFVGKIWEYLLNNTFPSIRVEGKVIRIENVRLPKRLVDNLYGFDLIKGQRGGKTGPVIGDEVTDLNITQRTIRLTDGLYVITEKKP